MYRQGDVLLVKVASAPRLPVAARDLAGRIVLAEGEATGHAHAIVDEGAVLRGADLDRRFLEVLKAGGVDLVHEEHGVVRVPPGAYRVVRQREYSYPDSMRGGAVWVTD